jgi:superfamily II DNA/RNA helicase
MNSMPNGNFEFFDIILLSPITKFKIVDMSVYTQPRLKISYSEMNLENLLQTVDSNILQKVNLLSNDSVQQQCLPKSLMGMDVLCQAKAGMGKTAVFVLTTLNRLEQIEEKDKIGCLVLANTRELAYQISKVFERFSKDLNYKTQIIIGGENINEQIEKLKTEKPNIVVGTPGRVLGLIKKNILDTSSVKIFIIDECDKMLQQLGKLLEIF